MRRAGRAAIDVVRGALIGFAETIPGVSGGTIALVVGIYDDLIGSAGHLLRGLALLAVDGVRGRGAGRARPHLARVRWAVVIPALVGMALAIVVGARILAPLVEGHPTLTRAVFTGLILASLAVPIRLVGRWGVREVLLAVGAAVLAVVVTGLPAGEIDHPAAPLIVLAAAVAVCALVLPGVSGSFLLLAAGMYAPTLAAVNDRDLGYLALFALGAVAGLAAFVPFLQWALENHHRVTLAVMTGLMVGSLRALWPWQSDDGGLQAPGDDLGLVLLLVALGIAIVVVLLVVEARLLRRREATPEEQVARATADDAEAESR
ncbi:MAG: DUF368 domain-containing protein [Actinomycetales bacterium]|nr:DUF368 domain-containing protein [Actinomycetales bacterium]